MTSNRINLLVALQGADEGLARTIAEAERSLGTLATSAKTAGDKADASLAKVQAGFARLGRQLETARTQLLAFFTLQEAVAKGRELVALADDWNLLLARLKLATAGTREFQVAQQELFAIAQRAGTPIAETATLYGKLQQAVRQLGGEQKEALQLTETISQALRISWASAQASEAALLQFGQALSAGVLRGDEFNSVIDQSPRLAQALAEGLDVPIGRLRKMAEEGRLTADIVINALLGQKDKLAAEYASLPLTVSQAFERLRNAWGKWVHELDQSTGASRKLAEALNWLSQNLDTVFKWLNTIMKLALVVIVYRLLPALATGWRLAGEAAVLAAQSTTAAWAATTQSVSGAIATIGSLKTAFAVLAAAFAGWEAGSLLREHFLIAQKAGIFMVQVLLTGFESLQFKWEQFLAIFTSDTFEAAAQRHLQRVQEVQTSFEGLYRDAERQHGAALTAMETAAANAEEIRKRLEAVRQGTQEAVGRAVEAVHALLGKLGSQIGEVEQAANQAQQVIGQGLGQLATQYQALTQIVTDNLTQQLAAIQARYQQELVALEQSKLSQQAALAQRTQLLIDALAQEASLRQEASKVTLQLLDDEAKARKEAAEREGKTEEERLANVQRIENEVLAAKQKTLTEVKADYLRHIDALNAEANRHLNEVKRIEQEKRQVQASSQDRIRELLRSTMSDYEAYQDRQTQIADLQAKARAALQQGEFDQAKQYAKQAAELAAQTARAVKEGDTEVVSQKEAVKKAIESIRASEELTVKALEGEGKAHQQAAEAAQGARDRMANALQATQRDIDALAAKLKDGLKLNINADTQRVQQALQDLDKAVAEKERLLPIKADLTQAQRELAAFEQRLKEGKTTPLDLDLGKANAALDKLKTYAQQQTEIELQVATEKASAAITNVGSQMKALAAVETLSKHRIETNAEAAREEVLSLNGLNTKSEHTITVRKVETHASGGEVGAPLPRFARGGWVGRLARFPRLRAGVVPGAGDGDTVPATLDAGAFVLRKAAVRKYGAAALAALSAVPRFAKGGAVGDRRGGGSSGDRVDRAPAKAPEPAVTVPQLKQNREVATVLKMIDYGLAAARDYADYVQNHYGTAVALDFKFGTMKAAESDAGHHRQELQPLLGLKFLTPAETMIVKTAESSWRSRMDQGVIAGHDYSRDLQQWLELMKDQFYARGGLNASDTVPAWLTPGEFVVNRAAVRKFGVGFFAALNALQVPAGNLAARVQGFANGGLVSGLGAKVGAAIGDPVGRFWANLEHLLDGGAPAAPSKTIRVELAAGSKTAQATVAARDEARLLELLAAARTRSS